MADKFIDDLTSAGALQGTDLLIIERPAESFKTTVSGVVSFVAAASTTFTGSNTFTQPTTFASTSLVSSEYIGQASVPAVSGADNAKIYWNSTASRLEISKDGAAYEDFFADASAAGSDTQLQFNDSGSFGASANLVYTGSAFNVGVASSFTEDMTLAKNLSFTARADDPSVITMGGRISNSTVTSLLSFEYGGVEKFKIRHSNSADDLYITNGNDNGLLVTNAGGVEIAPGNTVGLKIENSAALYDHIELKAASSPRDDRYFIEFKDAADATLGGFIHDGSLFSWTGDVEFSSSTASTASTNGALVVTGGVGIGGKLWIDGGIASPVAAFADAEAYGDGATVIGSGDGGLAVGTGAQGYASTSTGNRGGTAVGSYATCTNKDSIAVGDGSTASLNAAAVGCGTTAGMQAVTIGTFSTATKGGSVSAGYNSDAIHDDSIVLGRNGASYANDSILFAQQNRVRFQTGSETVTWDNPNTFVSTSVNSVTLDATGGGTLFLADDGTYKAAGGGGFPVDYTAATTSETPLILRAVASASPTVNITEWYGRNSTLRAVITDTGDFSNQQGLSFGESYGKGTVITGANSVGGGYGLALAGADSIAWGSAITSSIAGTKATGLGRALSLNFNACIGLGYAATPSQANQLQIGSNTALVTNVRFNNGTQDVTFANPTIFSGLHHDIGNISVQGNTTGQTTSATADTFDKVTQFDTDGLSRGCTNSAASDQITVLTAGTYRLDLHASFSGTLNATIKLRFSINGTDQAQGEIERKIAPGGDVGDTNTHGTFSLSANDILTIEVASDGTSDTFLLQSGNFTATKI